MTAIVWARETVNADWTSAVGVAYNEILDNIYLQT